MVATADLLARTAAERDRAEGAVVAAQTALAEQAAPRLTALLAALGAGEATDEVAEAELVDR